MTSNNFIDPEEHKRVINENLHLRGKNEKSKQKIGLLKGKQLSHLRTRDHDVTPLFVVFSSPQDRRR
jgi:hypothetical protein